MPVKILAVTGASGGHIFPALAFLDTLKNRRKDAELLLVLPKRSVQMPEGDFPCRVYFISAPNIRLSLDFKNIIAIVGFLKGIFQGIFILLEFRPDIVAGFGSLASVPVVFFAWVLGIKVLIHEQNVAPGKANKLLSRFSDKIAVSFKETAEYFRDIRGKVIYTGNPLRSKLSRCDKNTALDFFGFTGGKVTILAVGGSQGSSNINLAFSDALLKLPAAKELQVIHISGARDYDFLDERYKNSGLNVRLFKFLDSMEYAYSACDFVISRAGATTIAEIMYFGLAAIIVPYPFARKHQLGNARVLGALGAAIIIEDSQLSTGVLEKRMQDFISNPAILSRMRSGYADIDRHNANDLFTDAVLSLAQ
jgi:UDP-N-acetylglucosamine--N-acetylmuramyl-(pentapeptide) pyrophosphoryl-undecaprenol N-acetylglucosamine transferase